MVRLERKLLSSALLLLQAAVSGGRIKELSREMGGVALGVLGGVLSKPITVTFSLE